MYGRVIGKFCVKECHFGFVVDETLGFGEGSKIVGSSGHFCSVCFLLLKSLTWLVFWVISSRYEEGLIGDDDERVFARFRMCLEG